MLDPGDLYDLVALKKGGSMSAAARARGVAISTISRRLETLEAALQLRLVDRRVDGVRLTHHGEEIATLAEPLAEQLSRVARAADGLRAGAQRTPVRVSATEAVIADVLAPAISMLATAGVDFPVHLLSQGDVVSLAGRDADLAVRMSRPEGASLYIRKLREIELRLFASTAYLAGRDPASLDLRRERLIIYDDSFGRIPELAWVERMGLAGAVAVRTGSTRAQLVAAAGGGGIALLPAGIAQREPSLVELPIATSVPNRTPWLTVHRDLRRDPAIRLICRWIIAAFNPSRGMTARG